MIGVPLCTVEHQTIIVSAWVHNDTLLYSTHLHTQSQGDSFLCIAYILYNVYVFTPIPSAPADAHRWHQTHCRCIVGSVCFPSVFAGIWQSSFLEIDYAESVLVSCTVYETAQADWKYKPQAKFELCFGYILVHNQMTNTLEGSMYIFAHT